DLAIAGRRRLGHRAQARDIGCEGRHGDTLRRLADDLDQRLGDIRLAGADAIPEDVGRIADEREHTLVADLGEALLVRRPADAGGRVELPVARVDDRAERRADGERIRFRDRMADGDEFDVEGPEGDTTALLHHGERDLGRAGLPETADLQKPCREGRAHHRRAEARPQLDEAADMVLVRVGDDDADEVLPLLLEEADVGEDEIDTRHILAREGDAAVDEQPLAPARRPEAVETGVHADLAETAERYEYEAVVIA